MCFNAFNLCNTFLVTAFFSSGLVSFRRSLTFVFVLGQVKPGRKYMILVEDFTYSLDFILAILWVVWRAHNFLLFHYGREDPLMICMKALTWLHSYSSLYRCINIPLVDQQNIVHFFDGAKHGGICGAGMVIRLQHALSYRLRMGIGRGSDMKAELLVLSKIFL